MKFSKKSVMEIIAKAGLKSAVKAAGVASQYGSYEPRQPKSLKELKK